MISGEYRHNAAGLRQGYAVGGEAIRVGDREGIRLSTATGEAAILIPLFGGWADVVWATGEADRFPSRLAAERAIRIRR